MSAAARRHGPGGQDAGRDAAILEEPGGLPRVKAPGIGALRISLAFFPSFRQIPRAAPSEAGFISKANRLGQGVFFLR